MILNFFILYISLLLLSNNQNFFYRSLPCFFLSTLDVIVMHKVYFCIYFYFLKIYSEIFTLQKKMYMQQFKKKTDRLFSKIILFLLFLQVTWSNSGTARTDIIITILSDPVYLMGNSGKSISHSNSSTGSNNKGTYSNEDIMTAIIIK